MDRILHLAFPPDTYLYDGVSLSDSALRGHRSGLGISFAMISYRVLIALSISKMRNLSFACLLFYLGKKCDILQNCHSIGG